MIAGPVFALEMVMSARRRRTYVVRVVYGLGLLGVLGSTYRGAFPDGSGSGVSATELSRFARGLFEGLVLAQGMAVVILAPALAAGAVAGEAQRKTLDDLLTTELSAVEILAGKAAARLTEVASLVMASVPALLVAAELGGLGPWAAVGAVAATLSTAGFLAALATLASTQARSTRGAMNATLTLALTWLISPASLEVLLPRAGNFGPVLYSWIAPINAWFSASSPFAIWLAVARGSIRSMEQLGWVVAWMIGLQTTFALIWLGLASYCLRRSARGRRRGVRKRTETLARVPCGDDPMLWKELIVPRYPAFYRPLGMIIGLALGGLLLWTTLDFAIPALAEVVNGGYTVALTGSERSRFLVYLRVIVTGVYLVYALGVSSDAAAGMTSERENDTWVSLVTTPLMGVEIVRAKLIGAIWTVRQTAFVFFLLVAAGSIAGSVHPLALPLVALELTAFTGFAAALGTWISLRSTSTTRAAAQTVLCLVALNLGPLLLATPLAHGHPWRFVGCTPWLVASSLVSFGDIRGVASFGQLGVLSDRSMALLWTEHTYEMALTCLAATLGYGLSGYALYRSACQGFDAVLDRPSLTTAPAVIEPPSRYGRIRHIRRTQATVRAR